MKRTLILLATLIFFAAVPAMAGKGGKTVKPTIIQNNPIVLTGSQILTIDGFDYTVHNNITLRDNASLVIKNSVFRHVTDYSWQFQLDAYDNSKVIISSSTLTSSPSVIWNFWGSSSLQLTSVVNNNSQIWHFFQQNTTVTATSVSRFYGTLADSAKATVAGAPESFVDLVFPMNATVDEAFPLTVGKRATYTFPNSNDSGVLTQLTMKNSGSLGSRWGITYVPTDDVTIRNTKGLTVTFHIPDTFSGITAEFAGLNATSYADQTWSTGNARLRLIQTATNPWSPIVGGNNTLIVTDSELSDNGHSYGAARMYVYRSSLYSVRSNEYVNMHFYDCSVLQDVVASDDSLIELHNTAVSGRIMQEGNGQVLIYQN